MNKATIDPCFQCAENITIGDGSVLIGNGSIASGVVIGHHVIIEGDVHIGPNTRIGHHTVIRGPIHIGAENEIFPFVSLGLPAQHPDYHGAGGPVVIGQGNVLREFVTIHAATSEPATILGNNNYIMAYSHIAHDCRIGNNNKLANNATLAGHVRLGNHCYLGLNAILHQRVAIGDFCMIGMNEKVNRHVPPFAVLMDGRFLKINTRGLTLNGFAPVEIRAIANRYLRGKSDDPPSASQSVIDDFLATRTMGGVYHYEKTRPDRPLTLNAPQ